MSAHDWSPREAASLLRRAREAATPTDDLALIEATIQAGLAEIKIVQSLAEGDPSRGAHFQRSIVRLAEAGEHLARHAAMEVDGDDIPH